MRALARIRKQFVMGAALLSFVILACGPLDQWQQVSRQQEAVATSSARLGANNPLIVGAFQKMQALPGYRLESGRVVHHQDSQQTSYTVIDEYDARGNRHTRIDTSVDRPGEFFVVDGHTYLYEPQYGGWTDAGTVFPTSLYPDGAGISLTTLTQLLTQIGAVPVKASQDRVNDRTATRYRLRYVVTEIAEALGQELNDPSLDLRGNLWIDDETGALLKLELLLFETDASQPTQEFTLAVSNIGQVEPIAAPAPVIDPMAIVSATATAEAWTVLTVELDYRDQTLSFELIPLRVTQTPASSPRRAEVQLFLRQLPDFLFKGANLEPFLAQLRHQLTLSLPRRNLVVTSSGFRLDKSDSQNLEAEVIYFFNADLEDFSHAELVIAGKGNPLFAPMPVEKEE